MREIGIEVLLVYFTELIIKNIKNKLVMSPERYAWGKSKRKEVRWDVHLTFESHHPLHCESSRGKEIAKGNEMWKKCHVCLLAGIHGPIFATVVRTKQGVLELTDPPTGLHPCFFWPYHWTTGKSRQPTGINMHIDSLASTSKEHILCTRLFECRRA